MTITSVHRPLVRPADPSMFHRALCVGAVLSTLPYAVLKLMWLGGSRIGLNDPSFANTLTMHVANTLTLGLDLAGAALAITFATRRGQRAPAALVTFPMWVGYGLLGQILLFVPLTVIGGTVGTRPSDGSGPIDGWVYASVYAGFTGLGLFLLPAFALYARNRWAAMFSARLIRTRIVDRPTAWVATLTATMGAVSLAAVVPVGPDAARMFGIEGVLSFVAAAGLFVLATGRAQVKAWVPVLAAFTGTGALFAWGLFQAVITIVPNDLVPADTPRTVVVYAAARCAVGLLGGWALTRQLRRIAR